MLKYQSLGYIIGLSSMVSAIGGGEKYAVFPLSE